MPDDTFTVELTERHAAMIYAVADMEAKSCSLMAARLKNASPVMSFGMAQEAARFMEIRERMRAAIPGLADADTCGPVRHRESRA